MEIFHRHTWDVDFEEAISIQKELSIYVKLKDDFGIIKRIAGMGIAFSLSKDEIVVTSIEFSYPDLEIEKEGFEKTKISFPYISGLFAFSAGPSILSIFERIGLPDLVVFPGRGIAHPRGIGLATHMGILLDIPTIACSRTPLWSDYQEPETKKGSYTFYSEGHKKIGATLRSKGNTRPIFITPGHKISLESSIGIILKCCTKYRLPEPIRRAHILAKRYAG
ncbi:MAG: endonuclease V [Candidatus Zixiibacteriota bacterium]